MMFKRLSVALFIAANLASVAALETVIGAHPKVRDVAVVGLNDAKWGERVHAVVIPHEGVTITEQEVFDWSKDRLAGYKRPRSVSFLTDAEMPRTATGKNQHRELREKLHKAGLGDKQD